MNHESSWLFNKDPEKMAYYNPQYNWVGFHPLYIAINQGQLVTAQIPPWDCFFFFTVSS